jgi:hypothetical protein
MEWATPVFAWSFWPERNLPPAVMRPGGALIPWDVSGDKIILSWKGGLDAVFWKELSAAERLTEASEKRLPIFLDWPRFRDLFTSGLLGEKVSLNPWLADWKYISMKTVQSGFDRRRIVPRKMSALVIPEMGGLWINSSPFEEPVYAEPNGSLVLNVSEVADTWISSEGILKCSVSGWVFTPF